MNVLRPADAVLVGCPDGIPDCEPLPVVQNGGECTSFWQPDAADLAVLNAGGSIMLTFPGAHPVLRWPTVTEYPAILATWPEDYQLSVAARLAADEGDVPGSGSPRFKEGFEAGARWQKGRHFNFDTDLDTGAFAIVKDAMKQRGVQLTKHGFERYKQDHAEAYQAICHTLALALVAIQEERAK